MVLKRKRSSSCLSSPSSSVFSSPPQASMFAVSSTLFSDASSHLHSRTMKRFRDSRPSDDEVHQRTLGLLFSAQQQQHPQFPQQPPSPSPAPFADAMQQGEAAAPAGNQQSLHRFWNINSTPASTPSSNLPAPATVPSNCDDCGGNLTEGGNDGMEVDGLAGGNTACGACGKHVCFSCSISNLGEEKRCLQCAGRRVWIGGIGWTNASVGVC